MSVEKQRQLVDAVRCPKEEGAVEQESTLKTPQSLASVKGEDEKEEDERLSAALSVCSFGSRSHSRRTEDAVSSFGLATLPDFDDGISAIRDVDLRRVNATNSRKGFSETRTHYGYHMSISALGLAALSPVSCSKKSAVMQMASTDASRLVSQCLDAEGSARICALMLSPTASEMGALVCALLRGASHALALVCCDEFGHKVVCALLKVCCESGADHFYLDEAKERWLQRVAHQMLAELLPGVCEHSHLQRVAASKYGWRVLAKVLRYSDRQYACYKEAALREMTATQSTLLSVICHWKAHRLALVCIEELRTSDALSQLSAAIADCQPLALCTHQYASAVLRKLMCCGSHTQLNAILSLCVAQSAQLCEDCNGSEVVLCILRMHLQTVRRRSQALHCWSEDQLMAACECACVRTIVARICEAMPRVVGSRFGAIAVAKCLGICPTVLCQRMLEAILPLVAAMLATANGSHVLLAAINLCLKSTPTFHRYAAALTTEIRKALASVNLAENEFAKAMSEKLVSLECQMLYSGKVRSSGQSQTQYQ